MKKCKSCKREINEKATKCPHCRTDQRNWFRRHPVLTVLLALFIIGIISSANGSSKKETSTTAPANEQKQETQNTAVQTQETAKPKEWTTVIELSGSSEKRSDIFALRGGKTKLTYTVKSTNPAGPLVAIYVLPEGHNLQEKGGFPETTVNDEGTDSTFLVKKAGDISG